MSQFMPPPSVAGSSLPPPLPDHAAARPRRSGWRRLFMVLGVLLLAGSMLVNVILLAALGVSHLSVGTTTQELATVTIGRGQTSQTIAVLNVVGMIDDQMVAVVDAFCRQVEGDGRVRAVLLRVDSPGGGVSACDQIYCKLKGMQERSRKTVVVSMGGVAASGGYYISAPADSIVAEPTTITGSIGVLSSWPVLKGTFDKLGVHMMIVRSSQARAWKASQNLAEEPAPYQVDEIQQILDAMHDRFAEIVRTERQGRVVITTARKTYADADGKAFTVTETEPFNGRIFMADEAKKLGLIDQVGYFSDAVSEAATLAGLDKPRVVVYHRRRSLLEEMGLSSQARGVDVKLLEELQTPRFMMMWKASP